MISNLQNAHWVHSNKKADLVNEDVSIIKMEFHRKTTLAKIGKQKIEFRKEGFWCPKIMISENNKMIAMQKQLGFWGTKTKFELDDQSYIAKTKQNREYYSTLHIIIKKLKFLLINWIPKK